MPKLPGINHLRAVNAFEKAGSLAKRCLTTSRYASTLTHFRNIKAKFSLSLLKLCCRIGYTS